MAKNYYVILGITSNATEDDIRSAYRRLAKVFHPDHDTGNMRSFLDIQEAYSVLRDAHRRRQYDSQLGARVRPISHTRGKCAVPGTPEPEPLIPAQGPAQFDDISLTRSFETFAPSFDEIFDRLWGNFRELGRPKHDRMKRLTVDVPITPQQAQQGGQARILVPARATCPTCHGQGGIGFYECPRCAGEGCMVGEYPVNLSYPPGLCADHSVLVSLDRFGIRNLYLTVNFRITANY